MINPVLFIGSLGGSEMLLIFPALLLLFGTKKIPELARGLSKGIREFKEASKEVPRELANFAIREPDKG